jgi:hypothetical protein
MVTASLRQPARAGWIDHAIPRGKGNARARRKAGGLIAF